MLPIPYTINFSFVENNISTPLILLSLMLNLLNLLNTNREDVRQTPTTQQSTKTTLNNLFCGGITIITVLLSG
jgi:hypothetical protein